MLKKIREFANENNMFRNCSFVVAGLSGGADSVCLLNVLMKLRPIFGYELLAVHIHHGIRGEEADKDMKFCQKLCSEWDVPFKAYFFDVPEYAAKNHLTLEEAGRKLRYEAFNESIKVNCNNPSLGKIAVAHHKNDQAETILFNICRGSGIRGLQGIKPTRDNIIRPLLCCTRNEIEEYLKEYGIEYCTDSTNGDNDYSRNRLRNEVIPYLSENINSKAVDNIAAMADNARLAEEYLEKITKSKYREKVTYKNKMILLKRPETEGEYMAGRLIRQAVGEMNRGLKDIGLVHIKEIQMLLQAQKGSKCNIPQGLWVERTREGLLFYREGDIALREPVNVEIPSEIKPWEDMGIFSFRLIDWDLDKKISNEVYTKCFDYDKIENSLQLRGRQQGDVIAIDEEGHHKKIKQYFVDAGMSTAEKDGTVLLADGSHIMWIVGGRIGTDYKISSSTQKVLEVRYGGEANGES